MKPSRVPLRAWEVLREERGEVIAGSLSRAVAWRFTPEDIADVPAFTRFLSPETDLTEERKELRARLRDSWPAANWMPADAAGFATCLNFVLDHDDFDPRPLLKVVAVDEFTRQLVEQFGHMSACEKQMTRRLVLEAAVAPMVHRLDRIRLDQFYKEHAQDSLSALCLSGGGIRSGTFSLGVLQGLAKRGTLGSFDYLSTVSGGGYTGAWLTAWIDRRAATDPTPIQGVMNALTDRTSRPLDPDPAEVRHLRRYSNYITPKRGVMSVDTWFALATVLRNLVLNWTVTLPILIALVVAPRLYMHLVVVQWGEDDVGDGILFSAAAGVGLILAILPRVIAGKETRNGSGVLVVAGFVLCLIAAGVIPGILTLVLDVESVAEAVVVALAATGAFGLVTYPIFQTLAKNLAWKSDPRARFLLWCFSGLVLTTLATPLLLVWLEPPGFLGWLEWLKVDTTMDAALVTVFGPPLCVALVLIVATVLTAITTHLVSDQDREWLARAMAWAFILGIGWLVISFCVILAPWLAWRIGELEPLLVSLGGVSGVLAIFGGWSGKTPSTSSGGTPSKTTIAFGQAAQVAAWVFLGCLVAGTSMLFSLLSTDAMDDPPAPSDACGPVTPPPPPATLFAGLAQLLRNAGDESIACVSDVQATYFDYGGEITPVLADVRDSHGHFSSILRLSWQASATVAAIAILTSILSSALLVTANRYSLMGFYRNRIITAYFGASRSETRRNTFVDFDQDDDIDLATLRPPFTGVGKVTVGAGGVVKGGSKLLHVVCSTLNLVGGKNLAWQERRAQSFTNSRLHAGSMRLGYQPTGVYDARKSSYRSLGTAVAYSGAAVNPNMGFHTSPGLIIVMTLFNVRVGAWMPSPGPAGYDWTDRKLWARVKGSLFPRILQEALGLTSDQRSHVNLSDGGHFDNMGLYEMVLRRCRDIVVVDAAQDGGSKDGKHYQFNSLSEAFRKIRIDFGVEITLNQPITSFPAGRNERGTYTIPGTIHYPDGTTGRILVIKPAVYGEEALDVVNFARKSVKFPQEATFDFWYTESQFESYRRLGEASVMSIPGDVGIATVEAMFVRMQTY